MTIKRSILSSILALACNLVFVYVIYFLCRAIYLFENWSAFSEGLGALSFNNVLNGCFKFDTSAILYTNAFYAIMMLLPLGVKENISYQKIAKWIFLLVNSIAVIVNLCDAVYFQYTGRRTTVSVFQEFSNDNNILDVFGIELVRHWYLFLAGILLIVLLKIFYLSPIGKSNFNYKSYKVKYYGVQTICLSLFILITIGGIRGGFTKAVRPITISNANQYVNRPVEAALVLNTPFSILRSIGKNVFKDPKYFTREELENVYSPIHYPSDSIQSEKKNVVVLIMESFAREYIGYYNEYKGFTEFTDSLLKKSLTYEYTFSNGRKSIDGMPSVLSGIPRFNEPFFLTPASMNDVSGIAGELQNWGYYTAFFHGAENGSMGFEAFARKTGYQDYFGRTEYNNDNRFEGDKDFDGTWAIWDEEFMQFYALKMTEMKEPFMTTLFSASSHHPYKVPSKYENRFKDEAGDNNPLHKCIRYVDYCLQEFFKTAEKQPWYKNTIFVITADHTNIVSEEKYNTDLGLYAVPIFFYDPSGTLPIGIKEGIAQQTDIMPTILNLLGYDKTYLAFGKDLIHTEADKTWAVNQENGVYQFIKGDYVVQMTEDTQIKGVYDFKKDWMLKNNLTGKIGKKEQELQQELKAIIQDYMIRMVEDKLTVKSAE